MHGIIPRYHLFRLILTSATGAASCLALACGSDSTKPDDTEPAAVATVELSPAQDTLEAGTTASLTVTVKDASGNILTGRPESWASSDVTIATVDQSGLVTAVDNGTTLIRVMVEGESASAEITAFVGVTGTWEGSLLAGTDSCPITQMLTESLDGGISGSGSVGAPCSASSYIIAGMNDAGGTADSVYMFWNGSVNLTLQGHFDGADQMGGYLDGGGCGGAGCPYSLTRTSVVGSPEAILARSPHTSQPPENDGALP